MNENQFSQEDLINPTAVHSIKLTDHLLLFSKGFDNLLESVSEGLPNDYFKNQKSGSTDLSTISYIPNNSTTPPELSNIPNIVTAVTNSGTATPWYVLFEANTSNWTFGAWLKKPDYDDVGLVVQVGWAENLSGPIYFSEVEIFYNNIFLNAHGIACGNYLTDHSFNASFEITDIYGDWFYLQIKQTHFDANHPECGLVGVFPKRAGDARINETIVIFHPALALENTTIDPRAVSYADRFTTIQLSDLLFTIKPLMQ